MEPKAEAEAKAQQPTKARTPVWVWILLSGGGLLTLCCFGSMVVGAIGSKNGATTRATQVESARQAAPLQPQLQVDALKLWDEYHANEVAADGVYKGRVLQVSGVVHAITKDFTGGIVVELEARNPYLSTHARLDDGQESSAAALHKGEKVVLICTGSGMVVGFPSLSACVLKRD